MGILDNIRNILIGNKVLNDCHVRSTVGYFGLGYCWSVMDAKTKSSQRDVTIFWLKFKSLYQLTMEQRTTFLELVRSGVKKLNEINHPSFIKVLIPIEETSEDLAFATEPIYGSVASIFCFDVGSDIKGPMYRLQEYEMINGIETLSKGLQYLESTRVYHGSVFPNFVVITKKNELKLATLDLSQNSLEGENPINSSYEIFNSAPERWIMQGCLLPPESCKDHSYSTLSDVYSLGMLICSLFYSHPDRVYSGTQLTSQALLSSVPISIRHQVERMLKDNAIQRISLDELLQTPVFHQPLNRLVGNTKNFYFCDKSVQMEYISLLEKNLDLLPEEFFESFVEPILQDKISHPDFTAVLLPIHLRQLKKYSQSSFDTKRLTVLSKFFESQDKQVVSMMLAETEFFSKLMPWSHVDDMVLPFLFRCCQSNLHENQAVQQLLFLSKMENFHKTKNIDGFLSLTQLGRVKVIFCVMKIISDIIHKFEKSMVVNKIIPKLIAMKFFHPTISLAMLGFFRTVYKKFVDDLDPRNVALQIIPFILKCAYQPGITKEQFKHLNSLITNFLKSAEDRNLQNLRSQQVNTPTTTSSTSSSPSTYSSYEQQGEHSKDASVSSGASFFFSDFTAYCDPTNASTTNYNSSVTAFSNKYQQQEHSYSSEPNVPNYSSYDSNLSGAFSISGNHQSIIQGNTWPDTPQPQSATYQGPTAPQQHTWPDTSIHQSQYNASSAYIAGSAASGIAYTDNFQQQNQVMMMGEINNQNLYSGTPSTQDLSYYSNQSDRNINQNPNLNQFSQQDGSSW